MAAEVEGERSTWVGTVRNGNDVRLFFFFSLILICFTFVFSEGRCFLLGSFVRRACVYGYLLYKR